MKLRLAFLTKLLVLLALMLASMPSGATETVCVVGKKKRVVAMGKCGMPCCAHKPKIEPRRAACCKPTVKPPEACPANLNCHCETRYVATSMPAQAALPKFSLSQFELGILSTPVRLVRVSGQAVANEAPVLGTDVDPPRKVPRAPMRGRAPPAV